MEAIKKGWSVFKMSFHLAQKSGTVWLLILLSLLTEILVTLVYLIFTYGVLTGAFSLNLKEIVNYFSVDNFSQAVQSITYYQKIFLIGGYLFLTIFVATFYNFAITYNILEFLKNGRKVKISEAVKFSMSRLRDISVWTIVLMTVNVIFSILNNIAERFGRVGEFIMKVINGFLGTAWNLLTLFVVPIYVENKNIGLKSVLKRSKDTFVKTWGETVVAAISVTTFSSLFIFLTFISLIFLSIFVIPEQFIVFSMVLSLVILFILILFASAMEKIFKIVLYIYASTGEVPKMIENKKEIIEKSFVKK